MWFANGGTAGTFVTPAGDFSTLSQNQTTLVYTRTLKDGTKINFNSSGYQTSLVDTNNNTTTFSYNGSNQLTTITDFNNLVTTFGYTGTQVTSITDPANRTTTLSYTGTKLTGIHEPDGDQWTYGYNGSAQMTSLQNPRNYTTTFAYNFASRASTVTRADNSTEQMSALQMQGLVQSGQGTLGNPATAVLAAQA